MKRNNKAFAVFITIKSIEEKKTVTKTNYFAKERVEYKKKHTYQKVLTQKN